MGSGDENKSNSFPGLVPFCQGKSWEQVVLEVLIALKIIALSVLHLLS